MAYIGIPADLGLGKKLDATSYTTADGVVHAQKLVICDASGNVVGVTSGRLQVDGSGVPQPVTGTFWPATQPVSAASLPLPSGAAQEHATASSPHSARLTDGTTYIGATAQRLHVDDGGSSLSVDDNGGSLTVDGAVSVSNFPATQ